MISRLLKEGAHSLLGGKYALSPPLDPSASWIGAQPSVGCIATDQLTSDMYVCMYVFISLFSFLFIHLFIVHS
jgi:hypothetical protein